jgi:hypothetical protein
MHPYSNDPQPTKPLARRPHFFLAARLGSFKVMKALVSFKTDGR